MYILRETQREMMSQNCCVKTSGQLLTQLHVHAIIQVDFTTRGEAMIYDQEVIRQAAARALLHAKENGIKPDTICTTQADEFAFRYLRTEGDEAIIATMDGIEKRPIADLFDVHLMIEYLTEIRLALSYDDPPTDIPPVMM